jgi:hypothetical protein
MSVACKGVVDDKNSGCNLETFPDKTLGLLPSFVNTGTGQYDPQFPNGKIDSAIKGVPPTPKAGVCP